MLQDSFLCSNSIISIMYVRNWIISIWIWKKEIEQDFLNNQVSIYLNDASKFLIQNILFVQSLELIIVPCLFADKKLVYV